MEITMRKISAQSFDVASMCIENIGITPVHILIDLKDYPEYHIYRRKENFWSLDILEEEGVILPPEKSVKFNIHFEPTDVARYQFYLPITINGILGPPMMQDVNTEYYSYYLKAFEELVTSFSFIHFFLYKAFSFPTRLQCLLRLRRTDTQCRHKNENTLRNYQLHCNWTFTEFFNVRRHFSEIVAECFRGDY